jgi:hypothetical protein
MIPRACLECELAKIASDKVCRGCPHYRLTSRELLAILALLVGLLFGALGGAYFF